MGSTSALTAHPTSYRLNITARLEADVDGDGFGDETQDTCPTTAGSVSGCVPASAPAQDTTPPSARLTGRRDSIRDGRVGLWVTATEAVTLTARGTVRIASHARVHRLRAATSQAAASTRVRVALRLSSQTRRAARRALRRGQRLRARITITVRDAAGNTATAKHAVQLRR
jgi:hypothetical protein